jgi:hypothetical protein
MTNNYSIFNVEQKDESALISWIKSFCKAVLSILLGFIVGALILFFAGFGPYLIGQILFFVIVIVGSIYAHTIDDKIEKFGWISGMLVLPLMLIIIAIFQPDKNIDSNPNFLKNSEIKSTLSFSTEEAAPLVCFKKNGKTYMGNRAFCFSFISPGDGYLREEISSSSKIPYNLKIRHPEHATIDLGDTWHIVFLNTESEAKASRNVAFID